MDHAQIKTEVGKIMDAFGMSGKKVAEGMNISYQVFKNKSNDNSLGHTFNEKNLSDLQSFIGKQIGEVILKKELTDFGIFLEVQELNSIPKVEAKVNKWLQLRNQLL